MAKSWLKGCCESHIGCFSSSTFIPTRLLFLSGDRVALRLSSSLQPSTKYATLSHCWGPLRSLILTRRNLQLLVNGLHVGTLCQTFQDAVFICQDLGLQYLWIDSLCIIQDDEEDWKKESMMMSSVYSSSTLNIAATSAADGNGGCFFNRDSNHSWRHRITTLVHGREMRYECVEDGISDACLFQTPLANRAWAIQERLLAPRTLHCSVAQLFWECNTTTACEVYPQKFPDALKYGDSHFPKQLVTRSLWPTIVKFYSRCQLTFGKDKLVAISGIARTIHDQDVNDSYVAGLWRQHIEQQLCWQVRTQELKVETPRAPSWSWASVDGIVDLPVIREYELYKYIDVLDVDIGPYNPFGEILAGKIVLSRAVLLPGIISVALNKSGYEIEFWPGTYRIRSTMDYLGEQPDTVKLLPVVRDPIWKMNFRGLILQPTGGPPTEYQRLGYFECEYCRTDDCNNFSSEKLNYDCDKGLDIDAEAVSHIVTIV